MDHLHRFWHDISHGYERHIIDEGKSLQVVILVVFLLTFITVRVITHAIRAGRWTKVFHNLQTTSGTHLHHLVPGIILLLVSGFFGIGLERDSHRLPFAILYGIGAGLTLDEFALWLHLENVYWAKQGRQSIDAVIIFATILMLGLLGGWFWVDVLHAFRDAISRT